MARHLDDPRGVRDDVTSALAHGGALRLVMDREGHLAPVRDDVPTAEPLPPPEQGPPPVAADASVFDVPDHQAEIEALRHARPGPPPQRPEPRRPARGSPLSRLLGRRRWDDPWSNPGDGPSPFGR